jgi:hypothetical protein
VQPVAWTIADLAGRDKPGADEVAMALRYHGVERLAVFDRHGLRAGRHGETQLLRDLPLLVRKCG